MLHTSYMSYILISRGISLFVFVGQEALFRGLPACCKNGKISSSDSLVRRMYTPTTRINSQLCWILSVVSQLLFGMFAVPGSYGTTDETTCRSHNVLIGGGGGVRLRVCTLPLTSGSLPRPFCQPSFILQKFWASLVSTVI